MEKDSDKFYAPLRSDCHELSNGISHVRIFQPVTGSRIFNMAAVKPEVINNNNNNNTQLVTRHMSTQCMAESQPRTGSETSDGTTVHIDAV